jgi:hypothetical protein
MTLVSTRYTSEIGCSRRRSVAARQIVRRQRRSHKKATEGRDTGEAFPFFIAYDHNLPFAVASNDRWLALHRRIDDGRQIGLCIAELDFTHVDTVI